METVHWVRDIIEKGADWFSSNGRRERKGLRSFSISGRIKKPGVHVAPAGISINELIDEYCGGMLDGHEFYGYYPGGAAGGILPASLGDEPLDFDTLQKHDCFMSVRSSGQKKNKPGFSHVEAGILSDSLRIP